MYYHRWKMIFALVGGAPPPGHRAWGGGAAKKIALARMVLVALSKKFFFALRANAFRLDLFTVCAKMSKDLNTFYALRVK